MTNEKGIIAKAEDASVNLAKSVGGAGAAAHQRAAIDASHAGHLLEGIKEAFKVDGAIITHVTGHDAPATTPAIPGSSSEGRKR